MQYCVWSWFSEHPIYNLMGNTLFTEKIVYVIPSRATKE